MEFNAEFRNPKKAWLLIFDGDTDRSIHVSESDVREIMDKCKWLLEKFAGFEPRAGVESPK
jgi:hypothetical protein